MYACMSMYVGLNTDVCRSQSPAQGCADYAWDLYTRMFLNGCTCRRTTHLMQYGGWMGVLERGVVVVAVMLVGGMVVMVKVTVTVMVVIAVVVMVIVVIVMVVIVCIRA